MAAFRKMVATSLTTDFRKACEIVTSKVESLGANEVLVKARYVGINATDINVTAGRYGAGQQTPFDVGLEGIGSVEDVGENLPKSMIGQAVAYIWTGSFGEYVKLPSKVCLPIPEQKPEYIPLLISGLTASISLDEIGRMKAGDKVLVTAAAGGTGHIAVQLAKSRGCHVIGTCSNAEKEKLLKSLGCDHVINYKTEKLGTVLKEKYPKGIDVVYESIGGEIFEACLNRLAVKGRMVVLGYIGSYHSPAGIDRSHRNATLMTKLLLKSARIGGFFLMNHGSDFKPHFKQLVENVDNGNLKVLIDQCDSNGKPFVGLESVYDAVDHLYSRKSKGKVIVDLTSPNQSKL